MAEQWIGSTLYRDGVAVATKYDPNSLGAKAVAGGVASYAPTTQPKPTAQPQVQPQAPALTPAQSGGFNEQIYNQYYAGWGRTEAEADYRATGGSKVSAGGGMGVSTPTINLPELYKGLYESSGVSKLEADYSAKEKAFNEAYSKINDNPFLSEASRVGRQQKLQLDFTNATANIQRDIATKKADIETQLNLQTKQFDIESQVAKNALSQLNSLLDMGALDKASGETIANLTRSTGISSDMINSAIASAKKKGTTLHAFDDGTNQGFVALDQEGNIVKKTIVAPSKKKGAGGASTPKALFLSDAETIQGQQTEAGYVGQFPQLVAKYAPFMTLQEIYKLYLQTPLGKKYGAPTEDANEIKEIYDAYRGK